MNKRRIGKIQEEKAKEYLQKQGVIILEQNFRVRQGEIDLIGYDKDTLLFVEVKYRKDKSRGLPEEAVTVLKQRQISKVAEFYLIKHPLKKGICCRYDVVAICGDEITWYQNAFWHQGRN